MWAMVVKEFRQVRRDRRTLAMMIVLPVVMLVIFGYAASFDVSEIPTIVVGPAAEQVQALLPDTLVVEQTDAQGDRGTAEESLVRGEAAVALVADPSQPLVLIDGSQLFAARAAVQIFTVIQRQLPELEIEILFNPELDTSAVLVPGLAGLILLFIGGIITSLGVVRERQAGTLEQLAVMPLKPRDVFLGKVAPYFLVATVDLAVVLVVGTLLFDVPFNGNLLVLVFGALLFLFVTLGIGVLISSVSQTQGEAIQLAIVTLVPQFLLSGIVFPLESMAVGVRWIGYLLPLTYFNQIARGVMLRGAPLDALILPFVLLAALGLVVFSMAVIRFRRDLATAETAGE